MADFRVAEAKKEPCEANAWFFWLSSAFLAGKQLLAGKHFFG
jgi:hypothetical protein